MKGDTPAGEEIGNSHEITTTVDTSADTKQGELEQSDSSQAETTVRNKVAANTTTDDANSGLTVQSDAEVYPDEAVAQPSRSHSQTATGTDELIDKKILITGGAGFIGSHLSNRLTTANDVIALDDFSTGSADNVDSNVELVEGDITDEDTVGNLVDGVDVLVHMAAMMGVRRTLENPLGVLEVNMEGTKTVLQTAKEHNVDRVLFTSTSEVYGDLIDPPYGETDEKSPKTNYAVAKLADERYTKAFCREAGIDYTIVRYFNVYGPRQESSEYGYVVPRFITHAQNDERVPVHGDGSQTRDFTYIDDAIDATIQALGPTGVNETFNIGSGTEVSIAELARTVVDTIGSGEIEFVDHPRPYTVDRRCADVSKLDEVLDFEPEIDLESGIKRLAKQI
ncbi:NAD-dependent epimerase/dehydratase family protein [Natrinema halophilum]|uniref:NAD-dependent epimerase/dehydratase family protein n=1 Tax=Natrinema halophilum TaxID=1699371 RepID=A0A7D5KPJ3_9EURY|nr:NAD-dependent epimerase/dehydratase family protein [Natrinema halophilum]QLG47417.1 NAD-dependent epimerase/dehydratase family protein [Natrinema halophilum]